MKTFFEKIFKTEPVNVFPNPTSKGKVVNLTLKNTGKFFVNLIDGSSKLFFSDSIEVANKEEVKLFNIPANISNGIYYIQIIEANTNKITTSPILVL